MYVRDLEPIPVFDDLLAVTFVLEIISSNVIPSVSSSGKAFNTLKAETKIATVIYITSLLDINSCVVKQASYTYAITAR